MNSVFKSIRTHGIVPVVKIIDASQAVPLAKTLSQNGLRIAEVTFRTDAAEEAISSINEADLGMLLGAGTVLSVEQAEKAAAAGAKFIVTPAFNPRVVEFCVSSGIPVIPGCSSAADLEKALEMGLDVVKFFPAEPLGGLKTIQALSGPYPSIKFVPTGGIGPANLLEYLSNDNILACGGSWIVPADRIAKGDFSGIASLVSEAVSLLHGFSLMHIGINTADADTSQGIAETFSDWFNMKLKLGNSSNFVGTMLEIMKKPFRGDHGHIAIGTNDIERASAYLENKGVSFDYANANQDANGRYIALYMQEQIGGFAIHLFQK